MDTEKSIRPVPSRRQIFKDFAISFLMPTLIGKGFILYFGQHYVDYPGEGYGYGLCAAIAFTVFMLSRFIWKYRGVEDL